MARRCPYCGESIGDEIAYSKEYGLACSVPTKHKCQQEQDAHREMLKDIFKNKDDDC